MSDCVLGVSRSLSGRRWIWRSGEDRIGLGITQRMGLPEIVGRLLASRGIDIDTASHYLDPTLRALLPDPSTLPPTSSSPLSGLKIPNATVFSQRTWLACGTVLGLCWLVLPFHQVQQPR
jgi:hypothetical protein